MVSPSLSKASAQTILKTLWGDRPESVLGEIVIEYLSHHTDAIHIPFEQFVRLASREHINDPNVVLNVVNYLTGSHLNLLETGFEYIEGDNVEPLKASQAKLAKQNNINPLTGEQDEEIASKIFVFFYPSTLAKQVLGAA